MKLLMLLLIILCNSMASGQSADVKILYNGNIYTGRTSPVTVEAVAIRADKILAAGSLSDVQSVAGPKAQKIDLGAHI